MTGPQRSTCANCGKPIVLNDRYDIWFHDDPCSMWCHRDDLRRPGFATPVATPTEENPNQ